MLYVTTDSIPGQAIERVLGAVACVGTDWGGTADKRCKRALAKASAEFESRLASLGADAVVGYSVSISGVRGFWGISLAGQNATATVSGTAVKLSS